MLVQMEKLVYGYYYGMHSHHNYDRQQMLTTGDSCITESHTQKEKVIANIQTY